MFNIGPNAFHFFFLLLANIFQLVWICRMLSVSPSLSLVEQQSQQTDSQTHQQEAQHPPHRLAPPGQSWNVAVVVIVRLRIHSSAGKEKSRTYLRYLKSTSAVWSKNYNPDVWWTVGLSVTVFYSREAAHGVGVPHKQILAFIRLQHELWDADAC